MKTGRESRPETVPCLCQDVISHSPAKSRYKEGIVSTAQKITKMAAAEERLLRFKIGYNESDLDLVEPFLHGCRFCRFDTK
jgi:hypothetical protein